MAPAKKKEAATSAKKKSISFAADVPAEKTANKKKAAVVAPPAKPVAVKKMPEGVVVPRRAPTAAKKGSSAPAKKQSAPAKRTAKKQVESESESESESDSDEDEEDLDSDLESLDDSSDDENELTEDTKGKAGKKLNYPVLVLRYLPAEFQEPQLQKFLNQFGAKVVNVFCVRSKRTNVSKGTAYVQFDNPTVLPLVIEECNGMMLGGRTVRAHKRMLHRPMPHREEIRIRRLRGYRAVTQGRKLTRHNTTNKNLVAALIKYSRSERTNNAVLKNLGIDYSTSDFQDQLKRVPKELFKSKKANGATKKAEEETPVVAKEATTPSRKSQSLPATAEIVQPKAETTTPVKSPKQTAAASPSSSAKKTPAAKPSRTPSKKSTPAK